MANLYLLVGWRKSLVFNLMLYSYKKHNLFARIIHGLCNRIQSDNETDTPVLSCLNHQVFVSPFSHKLPFYQKEFPLYDRQLSKLCFYMKEKLGKSLNIIDIGANVGDTVVNIGLKDAFYLCIEGDNSFSKYIKYNLRHYNYVLENVFLSDTDEITSYTINSSNGTGHLVQSHSGDCNIPLLTLDNLFQRKYSQYPVDLLKIDTDGFDFKVIRGAKQLVQKCHPLIFFEWVKSFLEDQGEDPLSIFPFLYNCGYSRLILFDNFGNPIDVVLMDDDKRIRDFINNTSDNGPIYYYDVLAVSDKSVFEAEELFSLFGR